MNLENLPSQPGEDRWHFRDDLKAAMLTRHAWGASRPAPRQADLSGGVRLVPGFPDPAGRVDTAYEDLRRFLEAGGVAAGDSGYPVWTAAAADMPGEAFRLEVEAEGCRILGSVLNARGGSLPRFLGERV